MYLVKLNKVLVVVLLTGCELEYMQVIAAQQDQETTEVLFQMPQIGFKGSQCVTTRNSCACAADWSVGGSENLNGCQNPGGLAKQPWCVINEESCNTPRGILIDGQVFDYCISGCSQVADLSPSSDTVHGCSCLDSWSYGGQLYSGCQNPDGDLLGRWCVVDTESCTSQNVEDLLGYVFNTSITDGISSRFDYCYNQGSNGQMLFESALETPYNQVLFEDEVLSYLVLDAPVAPEDQQETGQDITPQIAPDAYSQGFLQDIIMPSPIPVIQQEECQSLVHVINSTAGLETFRDILLETALLQELSELKDVTVFAPTNDAVLTFANEQRIDVADLFLFKSNIAALREVYIVQAGKYVKVRLEEWNQYQICEGVLYEIDNVLLPKIRQN
eukprot:TRINITY_DN15082_c0_g2_i3.p1 TRINITY_DN15082_c0_g2~~TRINITY_DN15082_c0_g2_i3.p1  ORF type:complete len:387 (-),score=30.48 TRINITY_DN15082_c0_g2_i3:285-1445(-)